jgi:hypothetical protein
MKRKMQRHIQPAKKMSASNQQAREDILHFKAAVDSYTAQATKNPGLSFRRHLANILAAARKDPPNPQ